MRAAVWGNRADVGVYANYDPCKTIRVLLLHRQRPISDFSIVFTVETKLSYCAAVQ